MDDLLIETIESYNDYLDKVMPGCLKIAENLRQDEIESALQMILQFSEGMDWLVQACNLFVRNEVRVSLEVETIHEFLNEVNNGLEMQDYVLVADMFEYEVAPFFGKAQRVESSKH